MKTTFFLFLNNEGIPKRAKPAIVGRRPTGHRRCPQTAHFFLSKNYFYPNFAQIHSQILTIKVYRFIYHWKERKKFS
jgi:hypothetical protein